MVLFRMCVHLELGKRKQVLQSLARILGPTRALPGCISCQLCCDAEEENTAIYMEEWQTREHLEARLRSESMRTVMAAMDCATSHPEIRFETISETAGMELIVACRSGQVPV